MPNNYFTKKCAYWDQLANTITVTDSEIIDSQKKSQLNPPNCCC